MFESLRRSRVQVILVLLCCALLFGSTAVLNAGEMGKLGKGGKSGKVVLERDVEAQKSGATETFDISSLFAEEKAAGSCSGACNCSTCVCEGSLSCCGGGCGACWESLDDEGACGNWI